MPASKASLFGLELDRLTLDETVNLCDVLIQRGQPAKQFSVNAAKVVALRRDVSLRKAMTDADILSADGQSIVWASRILGDKLPERVAGIDLMERLLALATERQYSVFFLGARPEAIDAAAAELAVRHPNLVAQFHDGYFGPDDWPAVAAKVAEARPTILFVAMPSPRKELVVSQASEQLGIPLSMGVGGALDVIAGRTRRAPVLLQRAGLEWLFRLTQEPRRLLRRYAMTNAIFVMLVARALTQRRRQQRSVTVLGPVPPPLGGVSIYVVRVAELARAARLDMRLINHFSTTDTAVPVEAVLRRNPLLYFTTAVSVRTDVLHYHHSHVPALVAVALGLRMRRVRSILTVHGHGLEPHLGGPLRVLVRWSLGQFDHVVAVSDRVATYLQRGAGISAQTIPAFAPPQPSERQLLLDDETTLFASGAAPLLILPVYVVGGAGHKDIYGIELAAEAFANVSDALPSARLLIMLSRPARNTDETGLLERVSHRLEKKGLRERFHVATGMPLVPLLGDAAVLLRPSLSDGDSVSIREALHFNVPVIASDVADRPIGTVVVPVRDSGALERAIVKVAATGSVPNHVRAVDGAAAMVDLYKSCLASVVAH